LNTTALEQCIHMLHMCQVSGNYWQPLWGVSSVCSCLELMAFIHHWRV